MSPCPERTYIAGAVAALADELSAELRACEEILKIEADLQRRRVAENRYLRLRAQQDRRRAA